MTATTGLDIVPVPGPRKKSGRPPMTSRADLLAAAREIGFQELTIGRVTVAAGVAYSTSYRHWPNIATLTAALVDDVLAEATVPALTDWAEQARTTADVLRAALAAHPGMAAAIAGLDRRPPWIADARTALHERLVLAGFTPEEVTAAVNGVFHLALAEPGEVGWREIAIYCAGIAAGVDRG